MGAVLTPEPRSLRVRAPRDATAGIGVEVRFDPAAAQFCLMKPRCDEIGIAPIETMALETPEGELVRRSIGLAWVEFRGAESCCKIVIGEGADREAVGWLALFNLGFEVNPARKGAFKPVTYRLWPRRTG